MRGTNESEGRAKAVICHNFSQTDRRGPDSGAQAGHPADTDLRIRILAHGPDAWH